MRPNVIHWLEGFLPANVASIIAPSWFTCVGLAGVVTLLLLRRSARREGIDQSVIASVVLWCYVAAVGAGIIVPMLIDAAQQQVAGGDVALRWAGMTSFWGYLAGMGAVAIVCRDHGVPLARLGDLATAPLGLALAFARLGCFLGGCDYGKVTSLPWAVRFPAGSPAWSDHVAAGLVAADRDASLPVHPTQLYESMLGIAILVAAVLVARTRWARARSGRVFVMGAAMYALGRIGVETLRGDAGRGLYAGLSSGQIFSILVLVTIAAGFAITRRRVLHAIAAAALLLLVIDPHTATAQPSVPDQPANPYPANPYPQQTPVPANAPPLGAAEVIPARPAVEPHLELGLLLGVETPINRGMQVPALAGPSISIGYAFGLVNAWLDVDSFANKDATHGTLLLSGGVIQRSGKLAFGGRVGIGPTLVNFEDPAFRDVLGTTFRVEAMAEYDISDTWALWLRPITFDILSSAELGGPITSYQMRLGIAYRLGGHPARAASVVQPAPPPPQPYYYPPPYPYPYPYPPPPQQPAPAPRTP